MATGTQMVLEVKKNTLNNSSKHFTWGQKKTVVSSYGLFNTYKNKNLHLKQTL